MTTKAKAPRVRLAYKRQRCLDDHGSVQSGQKRKLRKLGTAESDEVNSVPTKQRASPASDQSPASSTTVQVTCRSEETVKLAKTLFECLTNQQGTGIYVPGQPGTGKTHTIRAVLESLPCTQLGVTHPAMALINCTDRQRCTLGKAILAGIYDSAARLKEDCSGRGMS
jgi:predicted ATPase